MKYACIRVSEGAGQGCGTDVPWAQGGWGRGAPTETHAGLHCHGRKYACVRVSVRGCLGGGRGTRVGGEAS